MTVNAELAAAVRRVNALYAALPARFWPEVDGRAWRRLERRIDHCLAAEDRDGALRAIADWEAHAREQLAPALSSAPLEEAA